MKHHGVKFILNLDERHNYSDIGEILDNAKSILNWQFDENLNARFIDKDIDYQIKDISNLKESEIEEIIKSFFEFSFDTTLDIELYKLLVLKNNGKLMILANINSLIFDYASINDFYELFDNPNGTCPQYDLNSHYSSINDYLNSSSFEKDYSYWRNLILNASDYIKFYNLKTDNYMRQKIEIERESVLAFSETHDCSLFDFYASVFSLYLARIDRKEGCILKTVIPEKSDSHPFDRNTLLKIDAGKNDCFLDLVNEINSAYREALNHTQVDVDNYFDNDISYYSVYDFSDLNENVIVHNGHDCALTLNIYNESLEIVYNSDLFSDVYVKHMAKNIESLIDNILDSPNQTMSSIGILSDDEKDLLSGFCKGKSVEVMEGKMFSQSFREHAIANPNAVAVDDGVNRITFGKLEKTTNSIANDLHENHGIGRGSRVGLMLPRNYHFAELLVALNKIAAAYVPIDLLFPAKRIEHMLNISQAEYLITTQEIAENLDLNANIIALEDLKSSDDVDLEILAKGDDLFGILFTSGTTGIPKGVMFSNAQIPWLGAAFKDIFNFSCGDVIGSYFSFSFVASFVICAALYMGGCVRIFNENEQKNSILLIEALKETHMNSLILPPSVGIPIFENEDLKLDYLILAGAKLNELSNKDRHTRLVNFYGTTEVVFAVSKIYDLNDIEDEHVPIGRPVANTWVYILDENGNQMPVGVPGEICISANSICQGYCNEAELTAESFTVNPYSDSKNNERMYRTGDIGFYNFEGEIEIIGREDDQLSVRGFRIESNEILSIMKSFEEISDIYLDVDGDNLIAYYTTCDDLDIAEVKDALKSQLPYYMIPSLFIELEKIPLNANGKIDRASLKKVVNNEDIEISDDVIGSVVDAFKEVLNLDFVMIDDDFVALGGNSLSAMKLQLSLKEKLDVYISSNEIMELSTPKEIGNHIKYNLNVHSTFDEGKYTFNNPCPLSESQLNVYLDESVNDMGTAYNNPFKIDFNDNYSFDEIRNALIKLFEVFPILKARVLNDNESLFFAFDADPEINEGSVNDIASFVKPFEFDRCLSRFLIAEDSDSVILCTDYHHLIFDGTSLNILFDKLISILNDENVEFIDTGALREISFEESIDSSYMDDAQEFFDGMLADRDEVHELMACLNGNDNDFEFIDTFDMDMECLSSFLQSNSITYNQFFTSIFAYTLSRFSGSEKVLFNIIEDGRGHVDLSESMGMFVKTLPVLMDCRNQNVDSYLEYSSNLINSVMKYDLYPFRILAKKYDLNSNILFQYSHDLFSDVTNRNDLKYRIDEMEHDLNADLNFFILNNSENKLTVRILYSSIYSKSFIKRFVESYKMILHGMIEADRLQDINYISSTDIDLLDSYNQTQHDFKYNDILDAFNDNLEKYESNILVGYKDTSYTHGQGAYISNEIADRLSDLGVAKQDYVALFVNRSEWFLLASMGVLSMGGIYVPIDTTYPDERILLMLEDTKSKAVIVDNDSKQRMNDIIHENDLNIDILNASDIITEGISTSNHLNAVEIDKNDVACVLYTSGTTGTPKGVLVTRKAVNNFVSWYVNETSFTCDDVYGMHCSYVFDMHTHALYSPVITGGALYVVPEEIRLDLKALNDYFVKHECTHTYITSQVGKLFAESGMETTIKLICFGGMKLGELNAPDSIGPFESYGPSENLAISTSIFANKRSHHSSIGRFISNVKGYILDNEHRRVPICAVGELYLAGPQLTPGYLNRDKENAKSFLNNPFDDDESHNRIYATGDLVRILPDGTLGIVGRRDSQVKIRGNRVELTEVESAIRSMDDIEDVTVQVISNNGNNELVAYIVPSTDLEGNDLIDYVREHVSGRKPEYMVPSYVVKLDEIPLNVNGKVNKSALPDVDVNSLHAEYVAPTNEIESHIIDAFEHVFNQKGIGLNDDFVRLGGDSITAIRVISLLEKNDITCSARDILNYKTPSLIAQNIERAESVTYDAVEGAVDLLPIQEYFFDQINRDNFTQYYILKSNEKLEKDILQGAFNELCNAHDMLRAKFSFGENGEAIQEIMPPNTQICEINEYDISGNLEESLKDIFIKSSNSLNVHNKLIEANLIHQNGESYVMFIIHHLIIDGVSWNILLSDLTSAYTNLKAGKEIELSRPYPYKNWVDDVKGLVHDISADEKQHWMKVNNLLDDSTIKGNANPFRFDVDVCYDVDNILMLSEEEYWALAIARAYKKTYGKDIIFNRESHGRDESIAKLNRTIGWFTSQYPILVNANNNYDDISLMNDVYNVKFAFKDANNLGLNYSSLIYTTKDLTFKHCPVTFNFLSSEFMFKNELFESINLDSPIDYEEMNANRDCSSYGITFNVVRNGNSYDINGEYAENTYLGDEFNAFIENIKSELEFIGNFNFKDNNIICCLSESQLGIYLDEKVNEKYSAYTTRGTFEYDSKYSIDDVEDAIHTLINKHPILRGRILDTENIPLLICDSNPCIEIITDEEHFNLTDPFDLDKSLARFFIRDGEGKKSVLYEMHHIISDATSLTIFNKEMDQALRGNLDDAIDLGFVYACNDSFESKYDSKYESAHEFFIDEFADIDDVQHMSSDIDGKMGSVSLPIRGIREKAESFTEENGITVGNLLNAAFAYTYSRFTGSDKVYYNFTEHGRYENYLQDALGMFVQTIPIIAKCENKSIKEYLTNTSDLILKSMTNSIYPFRLLAREFNLNNNVVFEYNHNLNEINIGNELVVSDDADGVSDFLCVVNDLEDGFVVTVSHLDKFSQHTAKQFVKVFKEVLVQFLEKENISDIDYISEEDIRLLDTYNKTKHTFVYDDILDAFNDNLKTCENNLLVGYDDNSYTHGEGAFIANEIANKLSDLGADKQDFVGLFVERSEWFLLTPMGVLSCGGIYVPIDITYPDERIQFMLNDSDCNVVIVTDETEQRMINIIDENNLDIEILNVSRILDEEIGSLNHINATDIEDNDIACVLYTSGTTGVPKGVLVTRKAINNFVSWYVKETNFTSEDIYGMHCSYVFDMHTHAIYSPVITGGGLYVVPEEIRLDLKAFNDYFVKHNCTHTFITSQVGKLFAESGMDTSIKLLCFGGMKLGELNAPDSMGPFESYGPSENLAISTSIFANERMHHSSIGRFISNVKGYVLDNEQRRLPIGAVGELYLAGPQLTLGYLNREEENEKSFFDNPFDDEEGYERIYATGDMVRFLPDGTLGIVGRRDSQVKIRGNRVELTEIEAIIREIDYVDDVTVQTVKNDINNEVVAYVVINEDMDDETLKDSIATYVGDNKPEYMIPSYVIKLDNIPLTVNGKIDRHALPEIDFDSLHAKYVPPTTEDEKIIVEAFEKVFNQKIGIHDDFIRLGGDSLTAIRLLSHINGYNITAVDILSLRTPHAIAKSIKKVEFDLDIYTLESGCPLNESQLNVYLDIKVNDKDDAYIIPLFMELSKKYAVNEIQDALNKLADVHPILSMRISDEHEVPYLVKGAKPPIIVENDVSDDFIIEFLNKPFDLHESLCRFMIVDDNDNYRLIAAFNHIIFDALSSNAFKHTLQSILDGETIDVDDSFLKASAFSQQIQGTDDYEDAKNFYESMLSDNEESSALLESIDATEQGKVKIDLDLDVEMLKSFLDKHNVSENILFTSAFAYALSRFTSSEYASFNLVENGRDRFNNFDSIGMYVNTLPILVNCKNQNTASFIEHASSMIYDVMKYNYYPFRLLANEYNINSDILFQYLPEWIGTVESKNISQNAKENEIIAQWGSMISDFNVEVAQRDKNYELSIMYSNRYSKSLVENFAKSYRLILQQITAVEKLDEINYITDSDIEILNSYNQTQQDFKYNDILDAFNDNLEKYESNILVGHKDTRYTHGQGAYISNEIAYRLSDLSVAKQDYVALFVNRSEWFLLASMGVLSMGGIYVPIDTTYPDERIILMLEDTQSKAVIVDNDSKQRMKDIIHENDLSINILNASDIITEGISTSKHLNAVETDENDIACVLYTSGTTGTPKGVLVTRKAINNFVSWYVNETGFTHDDVYGMHCSYVFDMHTHALYSPVITGGALYVVPEEIRLDLKALNDYFVKHGCTHTYITSQVGKLFAESGMKTTIKLICFGGMKLGELNAPDSIGPFESYGPSENLAISTSIFANKRSHHSSIGRFISNVKGYILDNEHRRVPIGAVGELYLAGPQLTPGYLNRDKENTKAFLDNPFDDDESHNRIYATGDLVRILPDGTLGIVGRRDSQVKIRGNRVELTEVESAIRKIDYVKDATVQTITHDTNNELVAYVVTGNDLDGDELKDSICSYVRKRKPDYMVPSYVIRLDEIPLNVNGKVDKRALPDVDRDSLHAEYVAPRNKNEKEIVEAFEKALNLERVSIHDDFIRLGGDSLTAIKLISNIESNEVTMADILTFRTPEAIAKNMPDYSFDLDLYSLESGCPLNGAQLNVFADVNIYNKRNAYHIAGYIAVPKEYSIERILDSLDELLNAHPILSMKLSDVYEVNDADNISNLDLLKDLIMIGKKFGIKKIMDIINSYGLRDVGGLYKMMKTTIRLLKGEYPYLVKGDKPSISVQSEFDKDAIIDFFAENLDIFTSMAKFMVVETEESYYLLYEIHHMIFDAISAGVLKKDFNTLLDGGSIGLDETFLKTSALTQQIKATEKFDEASEYYYPILSDLDDVGMLLEDSDSEGYNMSLYDLEFDRTSFKSFLRNSEISENVLFTSVFAYALSQIVNGDKVIFTMIENGRDRFDEDFIGMTSNVMPLVADCKDRSINSFLEHMASNVYGALRHSYYPILLLYQKYDFEVNILFQLVPNWIADDFSEIKDNEAKEIINHVLSRYTDYLTEFFVQIYQNGDDYKLLITHSNKFSENMVKDFKDAYMSILSNIINSDLSSDLSSTLK